MESLFEIRFPPDPDDIIHDTTAQIRKRFLIEDMFVSDRLRLVYTHYDRMVIAGVMPVNERINLLPDPYMKSEFFNKERETGIINVGGPGIVWADGQSYHLDYKEALYLGRGVRVIFFESRDSNAPAKFYINSCLAHHTLENKKVSRLEARAVELGDQDHINKRVLYQYIVPWIVPSCQLMMGITEVQQGNAWNTMPCHVHTLRMEAYFYFEIPETEAVSHFMGQPQETRHIWIHNESCVLSPDWSIHMAAGTHRYAFIWGMAGSDSEVDAVATRNLK